MTNANSSRPGIPADLQRRIWFEADFCCSNPACRTTFFQRQLEIHHIVPFSQSKRHKYGTLILLCAVCHDAYHRGYIGAKTVTHWKDIQRKEAETPRPLISPWYPRFYKRLRHWSRQGRVDRILQICPPLFHSVPGDAAQFELGLYWGAALHRIARHQEAKDLCLALKSLHSDAGVLPLPSAQLRTALLILEARARRALGQLDSATTISRTAIEAAAEEYQGWELHNLQARLGTISYLLTQGEPTDELQDRGETCLREIRDLRRTLSIRPNDAASLEAETQALLAFIEARSGNLSGANGRMTDALNLVHRFQQPRQIAARLGNLADLTMFEARTATSSTRRRHALDRATHLLSDAIAAASLNGAMSPRSCTVTDGTNRWIPVVRAISDGKTPAPMESLTRELLREG